MATKSQWAYGQIALLIVLLIASPLLFAIFVILFALYWSTIDKHKSAGQAGLKLDESNRRLLYIACCLTLASLLIYQTGAYATQLGFPTTFVTYYHPGSAEPSSVYVLLTRLNINPLQGALNAATYFLLLWISRKLWQQRHLATS